MKEEGLRKSSAWMVSGQLIAIVFQAIYFVLMGRTLGSQEYGAFVGVVALVTILTQFSSLGMEMVLVRNISRDRHSFAATWGNALRISLAGALLLLLISMAFGHFVLRPDLRMLIPWIVLSDAVLGKLVVLAGRAFQGAGQLRHTAQLITSTNAGRAVLAAVLYFYAHHWHVHPGAYTWARIYWLSPLVVSSVSTWMVTRRLGWPRLQRLKLKDLSEGFSFSLSNSSISIYNDIDKTYLVSLGQTYAAGIYSAAYRVIDVATAPLIGLYAAAMPRLFREGHKSVDHARVLSRRLMLRTVPYGIAAAMALYACAGLFPRVFGQSFAGSVAVVRWLCLLPLIRVLHYAWGSTITASASPWNRTVTQLGAAAFNLLLNALLIPRWSWQGAAIASLLTDGSLAIMSRLMLWRLQHRQKQTLTANGPTFEQQTQKNI
jgi:O-antigen/teichoic acid export membrane protein